MSVRERLPRALRRREAERRRVETFVAAIRATAQPIPPLPPRRPLVIGVERVDTAQGPVWQLDEATRVALDARRTDTAALPKIVARASASLR